MTNDRSIVFRVLANLITAACIGGGSLALTGLAGCVTPRYDFWFIEYHMENTGAAVVHMTIKAGDRTLDENYDVRPNGVLTRWYREGYGGRMPRPDSLYVQWVEESSGAVHEQRIDLRGLLPTSLEDQTLLLVFRGAEVYLFATHMASATEGHPLSVTPAPQLFPDPSQRAYPGGDRPMSYYRPD